MILLHLLSALVLAAAPDAPQETPPPQKPVIDPVDRAIGMGIDHLINRQQATGAIYDPTFPICQTAMTSMSVMAFLAVGHQPTDDTREGLAMRRALAFVLRPDRMDASGYFGAPDNSQMYGHGIITLMLAEVMGMGVDADQDRLIRERCQKGVDLILRAQRVPKPDPKMRGGWRYQPTTTDSDLSVTVWQLMALRAAKNAELEVPGEAIDAAVGFIKRCYSSPRGSGKAGACGYVPGYPPMQANPAAGLLSLQMCGAYDSPEAAGSAEWLRTRRPKHGDIYFFYNIYYYAQGMYQCGGTMADEGRAYVARTLLPLQTKTGAWPGELFGGSVFTTSMAVLALSVKYHFLPIYQR